MTDFPRLLHIAAKRAGLSQVALATILGASMSTVSGLVRWVSTGVVGPLGVV